MDIQSNQLVAGISFIDRSAFNDATKSLLHSHYASLSLMAPVRLRAYPSSALNYPVKNFSISNAFFLFNTK